MRLTVWLKAMPQSSHLYGFSPVWILMCTFRPPERVKVAPHSPQMWRLGAEDNCGALSDGALFSFRLALLSAVVASSGFGSREGSGLACCFGSRARGTGCSFLLRFLRLRPCGNFTDTCKETDKLLPELVSSLVSDTDINPILPCDLPLVCLAVGLSLPWRYHRKQAIFAHLRSVFTEITNNKNRTAEKHCQKSGEARETTLMAYLLV